MANPNSTIWGAANSWVYSELAYGIEGAGARFAGYAKPMTANFGDGQTQGYRGSLLRAINVTHKMTLNEKLDRSICPCGQAPDVSPWGKIAIFNENSNLSTTPSRIITDTNNINWFLCDRNQIGNNARYFSKVYNNGNNDGLAFQQFAPLANSPANSYNRCMRLTPYVYYGLRSFVATIQIHLLPKNGTYDDIIVNSIWTNLDNWVNYKDTHDLIGLRLFFRNCTSINGNTLVLTYNTDTSQYGGQYSNQIAVIQDITVNNNGNNVETEFLSLNMESGVSYRSGYIFDVCNVLNYSSSSDRRTNGVLPCWEYFEGQQIARWKTPDNTEGGYWYTIPYSQANYDKIMKIAALFGCFFTPTTKYTFNYDMLDNDLYLPILDENGVAHGQYTHGAANATNSLYSKNSIREIDYNPDTPPTPTDPNTYSNTTGFNYITEGAAMTVRYVLDGSNVDKLLSDLWTINANIAQGDFEYFDGKIKNEYLTTNPIDCIVSLIRYPFNIPYQPQPLQSYVRLGKTEGTAKGWTTVYISNQINFNGVDIFPRFGDCFLDYEPYTTYELYVPFCGTTKIRAADILGHTLNLTMLIDLITGSCTAYVKADELVIETLQGSCGIQQQLSGTDTATMNANIYNGILAQKQAKLNMVGTAVNALNPANWVNPVNYTLKGEQAEATYKQATYSIEHIETPVHMLSAASPLLGWVQEFNARLMIYYPTGDVITDSKPPSLINEKIKSFGDLNGFSCLKWGKVREFSGFTLGNIKLDGVPCTESERARLKQIFSTGVYL